MIWRHAARSLVVVILALTGLTVSASVVRADKPCHDSHCTATPNPTDTPASTPSPTSFVLPSSPVTGTLPPTATPAPTKTPAPIVPAPLPSGDAPQIGQAVSTPSGVVQVATLPTGGAPAATTNPLGNVVLYAFLIFLGVACLSTWLFFKLR